MKSLLRVFFVGLAACSLSGCGPQGGRVSVYEDAPGEMKSSQMPTRDLIEASDRVAEAFISDVNRLSDQDWDGYRVNMIMGDIQNKSGAMRTEDFELVQHRIKDTLMGSSMFRDNVKVISDKRRTDDLNRRQGVGTNDDPMQEGSSRGSSSLNPEYTFFLIGDAYGSHRSDVHLYYISFTLLRAGDREEVFSKRYEMKFKERR